jgi:hypothetical protein
MQTPATAAATSLLVERRFPLDLAGSIASIRELDETGKQEHWSPDTQIAWNTLAPQAIPQAARDAGRWVWSRRAWLEYTGLAETPALLIRFCLELGRESDPKYFLTVRNTEEAWHIECFHRYASALGGYIDRPADARWEPVINRTLYRSALDASVSLDAYVAVHCALEDGLELELSKLYLSNAREPVAAQILERVVGDKARHASFGWLYLEQRAATMTAEQKAQVQAAMQSWLTHVVFSGYQIPSLSTDIADAPLLAAITQAAQSGLGAATPEQEEKTLAAYLGRARERLSQIGLALGPGVHPRLGAL